MLYNLYPICLSSIYINLHVFIIIYVYKSTCDWHARALKRFRVTLRLFLCFGNNSWSRQESVTGISMLIISNRVKLCSLAFTAARMYATGAQANNNPVVFFDIAADSEPLGRVTFEVSVREVTNSTMRKARLMNINDAPRRSSSSFVWLVERTLYARQLANQRIRGGFMNIN